METNTTRPVDLLAAALRAHAVSRSLLRRVEDGKLHEEQVLATMWKIAVNAGIDAHMVDLVGSNHLLIDRDLDFKPKGYWYRRQSFLEIDGELLSFKLSHPRSQGGSRLAAGRYASRALAKKSMGSPKDFKWSVNDEEFENEYVADLASPELERDLAAAALAASTPIAPSAKRGPRL